MANADIHGWACPRICVECGRLVLRDYYPWCRYIPQGLYWDAHHGAGTNCACTWHTRRMLLCLRRTPCCHGNGRSLFGILAKAQAGAKAWWHACYTHALFDTTLFNMKLCDTTFVNITIFHLTKSFSILLQQLHLLWVTWTQLDNKLLKLCVVHLCWVKLASSFGCSVIRLCPAALLFSSSYVPGPCKDSPAKLVPQSCFGHALQTCQNANASVALAAMRYQLCHNNYRKMLWLLNNSEWGRSWACVVDGGSPQFLDAVLAELTSKQRLMWFGWKGLRVPLELSRLAFRMWLKSFDCYVQICMTKC